MCERVAQRRKIDEEYDQRVHTALMKENLRGHPSLGLQTPVVAPHLGSRVSTLGTLCPGQSPLRFADPDWRIRTEYSVWVRHQFSRHPPSPVRIRQSFQANKVTHGAFACGKIGHRIVDKGCGIWSDVYRWFR